MKSVTFNEIAYTPKSLEKMSGPELVALHNEVVGSFTAHTLKLVTRFADKVSAVKRTWNALQSLPAPVEVAAVGVTSKETAVAAGKKQLEKVLKEAVAVKAKAFRGTNLAPDDHKAPRPCRAGSKQAALVDLLQTEGGVTMEQLIAGLAFGKKPWIEATVRSGFGWDLKQKGYGVQSHVDEEGVERFELVVTPGYSVPAHTPLRGKAKAQAAAQAKQTSLFDPVTE